MIIEMDSNIKISIAVKTKFLLEKMLGSRHPLTLKIKIDFEWIAYWFHSGSVDDFPPMKISFQQTAIYDPKLEEFWHRIMMTEREQ